MQNSTQQEPEVQVLKYVQDGFNIIICPSLDLIAFSQESMQDAERDFEKHIETYFNRRSKVNPENIESIIMEASSFEITDSTIEGLKTDYPSMQHAGMMNIQSFPLNVSVRG